MRSVGGKLGLSDGAPKLPRLDLTIGVKGLNYICFNELTIGRRQLEAIGEKEKPRDAGLFHWHAWRNAAAC